MSRLALGTVQFGMHYGVANNLGQVSLIDAKTMLRAALANHIDTLDTAETYGSSEKCLGEIGTHEFKVITKLSEVSNGEGGVGASIVRHVKASLCKLRRTDLYGLLLHRPQQLLGPDGNEIYRALLNLKNDGLVKKVGVSIYSPSELDALGSSYCFDLVQAPFNLIDQRLVTSGWLKRLKDNEVEVHVRSAFMQGLLLMPQSEIPQKFLRWSNLWQSWHKWLEASSLSAVQASLGFALKFPEFDRVVVGADSLIQLSEIISASKLPVRSDFPNLRCDDVQLINPANWNSL